MNRPAKHYVTPGSKAARQLMAQTAKIPEGASTFRMLTTAEMKRKKDQEAWNARIEALKKSKD